MGRVRRITEGARSRNFKSNPGVRSQKFASDWGRPASTSATLSPASDKRLQAQPPDAPEPTTATSNIALDWSAMSFSPQKVACPVTPRSGQRRGMTYVGKLHQQTA